MADQPELSGHGEAAVAHILGWLDRERGYDFTGYQPTFVRRRLHRLAEQQGLAGGIVELAARVDERSVLVDAVIDSLGIPVTELFRDPEFWVALRASTSRYLAPQGFIRAWVAGCATGEEAYSLAMLLHEVLGPAQYLIYATDILPGALTRARAGLVAPRQDGRDIDEGARQVVESGDSYLTPAGQDGLRVAPELMQRIVFAQHNLVSDGSFNIFDLILCRNVMIYFSADMHVRVHSLLHDSLSTGGILGLGSRESLAGSGQDKAFSTVDRQHRLYRRLR